MPEAYESALRAAMAEHGITPPEVIVTDGKLRRFPANGRRGNDDGWIVAWPEVAVFGDWRQGGDKIYWSAKPGKALTEEQRRQIEEARRQAEVERQRRAQAAAKLAGEIWKTARPAGADHPYLVKKQVRPVPALRELGAVELARRIGYTPAAKGEPLQGRILIAPIKAEGRLSSLEFIDETGKKSALAGGIKRSGFWAAQPIPETGDVVIAEGIATALSVHEATGKAVAAALSVGNLRHVVEAMKAKGLHPIIAADLEKEGGKPHSLAVEAARACAVPLVAPPADILPGTDLNDLHVARGLEAVRQAFGNAEQPIELLGAAHVKLEAVKWLWHGWLAQGKFHILAGKPGTGKTTIALALAATITCAGRWPDGSPCREAGDVVVWSGEDDPADTLTPRLMAAGADLKRVHFVGNVRDGGDPRPFDPAFDVPLLIRQFEALRPALFIIDPVVSAVATDSHKNTEVRRALQPLVDLTARVGCAVLGISHVSKGTAGRDPLERVTGSIAFGALARVVLLAARRDGGVPPGEADRLLCRAKSNIGPDGGGVDYGLVQAEAAPDIQTNRVVWGGVIQGNARELLAQAETMPEEGGSELDNAKCFLADLLTDGPLPTKTIKEEANDAGYSWATIRRAQKALGIKPEKEGMQTGWVWRMPGHEAPAEKPKMLKDAEDAQQKKVSTFGEDEHLRVVEERI